MNIVVYILLIVGFGFGVLMSNHNNQEEKVTKDEKKMELLDSPAELDTTTKAKLLNSFTP